MSSAKPTRNIPIAISSGAWSSPRYQSSGAATSAQVSTHTSNLAAVTFHSTRWRAAGSFDACATSRMPSQSKPNSTITPRKAASAV